MPTSTTNYGLIKPGTDDPILVGQLNDNMDTIDTVLKDHSDKIDAAALGIKYKGEVNYYADLPNDAEIGDAYTVKYAGSSGTTPDGTEYVWGAVSGVNQWINFSKDSYSKAEVDALLALKQNALTTSQLAAVNSGIDSEKVAQYDSTTELEAKDRAALVELVDGGAKNLFQISDHAYQDALNGLTATFNADGSVTVTGTMTDTTKNAIVYISPGRTMDYRTYQGCVLSGGLSINERITLQNALSPYNSIAISQGTGVEITNAIPEKTLLYIFITKGQLL